MGGNVKIKSSNPPKSGNKNWLRKTTLTALSACRQRPASVPPACRHLGRQRSLQEMGQNSIVKNRDGRKDLGRKRINLAEIWAFSNQIAKPGKVTLCEVQQ